METGEHESERVAEYVPAAAVSANAVLGERFAVASGLTLAVSLAALILPWRRASRGALTATVLVLRPASCSTVVRAYMCARCFDALPRSSSPSSRPDGGSVALRVGRPPARQQGALSIEDTAIGRCVRAVPGQGSPYREALPGPVTDPALFRYLESLPADVRRTAVAAGIEPLIARVLRERERGSSLELIWMRQELDARVASLGPQLLAMEFEAECNIALLQRTLREYDEDESEHQLVLAIASLVASAGFGLAAAIWDIANEHTDMPAVPDGPLATAIVGVVPTTVLAAAALSPRPREVSIGHEHNLLGPIERGDDPDLLYPTFVFRLLTAPMAGGAPTPRDELLDRWNELIADAAPSGERDRLRALLFGGAASMIARSPSSGSTSTRSWRRRSTRWRGTSTCCLARS